MNVTTMEVLEARRLMSATAVLNGGLLRIDGDLKLRNRIVVATGAEGDTVEVKIDGGRAQAFALDDVDAIEVVGGKKGDDITIDENAGALGVTIRINGYKGNDKIVAFTTPVTIWGGSDHDTILGSTGDDVIYGDSGNDAIWGDTGDDYIRGGNDRDRIYGEGDDDILIGDSGNDTLYGGDGSDRLDGGKDHDDLVDYTSRGDRNTFQGGKGSDEFWIGEGDDIEDHEWYEHVFVDDGHGW